MLWWLPNPSPNTARRLACPAPDTCQPSQLLGCQGPAKLWGCLISPAGEPRLKGWAGQLPVSPWHRCPRRSWHKMSTEVRLSLSTTEEVLWPCPFLCQIAAIPRGHKFPPLPLAPGTFAIFAKSMLQVPHPTHISLKASGEVAPCPLSWRVPGPPDRVGWPTPGPSP